MIKVAAACFLGGAQAYMPPVILAVPSRAAQRRAILVTATPEKVDDAAAKLEALRAQVEAARQAAKESDYEWYLENAALLEGTERVASSPGDGRRTDAAPVPVASPVDAPAVAASQATTWDLTGSEVQTSELTSVEATAYRQFQAASSNNDAVNDAEWTADEADDVDPEFLSYDQGASVEVKPVEFDAAEYRSQQDEAVQKDERIAATLASLGYSAEEAASLVPDAVTMIVDLGFRRPQTTRLPADWTKSEPTQGFKRQTPRETSRSRSPETQAPPGRRRPSLSSPWVDDDDEDDDDDDDDVRARKGASTQRSGFLQNPYAIDNGEDCGDEYFDDDEDYDGDYLYSEDGGGDDDMSLYPSLDKFKEMLRAESNLRLTVAGPWIRDFVVTENRVRLALYKWWLKSLDEGIGDAPQVRCSCSGIDLIRLTSFPDFSKIFLIFSTAIICLPLLTSCFFIALN